MHCERLYNTYTSFPRGRFACSRLIAWGHRRLGFHAPRFRLPSGIVLEFAPAVAKDVLIRDLLFSGSFEPVHTEIIERLPPGGVLIDVGANVGYFSIVGAKAVGPGGKVYAFEPVDVIHSILCTNIALNGLSNVEAYHLACFSSSGSMAIEQDWDSGKSHLCLENATDSKVVSVTTVDAFVDQKKLARVDFIKIDAEGSDFEVLKGSRFTIEKFRPKIFIEVNHLSRFGGSISDVRRFFEDCRYEVTDVKGNYSLDLLGAPMALEVS
ncbi:MAG: FkbM family methyltransferase [Nitrospira sp.]|nr:FkbM family methyltransferase [Nitrospira sp.]